MVILKEAVKQMPEFTINKSRETMTSRERVEKTFAFEKTDRVTISYDKYGLY